MSSSHLRCWRIARVSIKFQGSGVHSPVKSKGLWRIKADAVLIIILIERYQDAAYRDYGHHGGGEGHKIPGYSFVLAVKGVH
jgi:hypothetical protein